MWRLLKHEADFHLSTLPEKSNDNIFGEKNFQKTILAILGPFSPFLGKTEFS